MLASAAAVSAAAPIYRCGQTYSQMPCPDGRIIDSSDPRTAAQRAEARRQVEREKELAAKMDRDRRAQDAASAPAAGLDARASAPTPVAASAPAKSRRKSTKYATPASGNVLVIVPRKSASAAR